MASRTLPGPTGRPAARRVRAKCMMFSARRPPPVPGCRETASSGDLRGSGFISVLSLARTPSTRRRQFRLHLIEDIGRLGAADLGDVVLVLEKHAQGIVDRLWIERYAIELQERLGPVDRFGDARQLEEVALPQLLYEAHDLPRQLGGRTRRLDPENLDLSRGIGVIDPIVEAAALQGVVDLARSVRGDDDNWRFLGADGPDLRDGDMKVRQHLQQVGLERFIGPI